MPGFTLMCSVPNDLIIESTHDALIAHSLEFYGNAEGGFIYRDDVMVAVAGPSGLAESSIASFRIDPSYDADAFIERSNVLFGQHSLDYAILLRDEIDADVDDVAESRGMRRLSKSLPRMIVNHRVEPSESARIVVVDSESKLWEWAAIVGSAFGSEYPPESVRKDLAPTSRLLDNPTFKILLGYIDDVAVSGGMLFRHGDFAYISNVGTIASHRNRGAASALVRHATNLGFGLGAKSTFLFASHGAARIWERIGFETISFIHHRMSSRP